MTAQLNPPNSATNSLNSTPLLRCFCNCNCNCRETCNGRRPQIRNSWSPEWGEEGSIRIKYGANTCGLVTEGGSYTDVYNI
jgi:hypothetical protein